MSRARAALEHYGFSSLPDFDFPGLTLAHIEDDVFPILMIDDFLTASEIAALRALAASPGAFASSRAGRVAGGPASTRSSTSFRMGRSETAALRARVGKVLRTDIGAWSSGKYIRYAVGEQFTTHMDGNLDFTVAFNTARGQPPHANIIWTAFVYLNDVAGGGETAWVKWDDVQERDREFFRVTPRPGRAIFFPVTTQKVPPAFEAPYRVLTAKPTAEWTEDDAAFRRSGPWRMDPLRDLREGEEAADGAVVVDDDSAAPPLNGAFSEIEFYPTHARHAGRPVTRGEKHLLTLWCYTSSASDAAWLAAGSSDFTGDAARRGRPDVLLAA